MYLKNKLYQLKANLELIEYNIKLLKYHINKPEPGTLWYWVVRSRYLFCIKVYIYIFGVIFIFFIFTICKFLRRYQSFVLFIYLCWFFSSLFYIEFIRV